MKFRSWLNLITILLLVLVVYFSWEEIMQAWNLLAEVNPWILALIVPLQIFSYYATGEVVFSYLRAKGELKNTTRWEMARIAFELNFVNHILPSGGAAGFSYLSWLLKKKDVSTGRSVMAQVVRFSLTFFASVLIILVSVLYLFSCNHMNRTMLNFSAALVAIVIVGIILVISILGNTKKLNKVACSIAKTINVIARKITRNKKKYVIDTTKIDKFMNEVHQDYLEIRADRNILKHSFRWAFLVNILDASLIFTAFLSLGFFLNPAILFIALGLSSMSATFFLTPGGTGIFETVMVTFLVSSGIPAGVAIAGTLLARVILLMVTILIGYVFYQHTIRKYGKDFN